VCREGGWDIAVEGIKEAVKRGFRVTTNATFFDGTEPNGVRAFFDEVMDMGVEGIVLSPGYSYDKAPDQNHFMGRARVRRLFRAILSNRKPTWKFNMSPLFLEFLMGDRKYECTPWGSPAYNIFGWQRPCYLLQDGYADTFKELLETTKWEEYGVASGNPKCANCMVSCGYEPSAVIDGFGSLTRGDTRMTAEVLKYTLEQVEALELAPGTEHQRLEGWIPELASDEEIRSALEKAFDYRGDVSITLKSGEKIEAYIFNRHTGATLADSWMQYFTPNAADKRKVSYTEIARLEFSGKDRAAGKHWEDWVKAYNEKKAAGEKNIALHPDALE
jgi:hypothetical protein